MPKGGKKGMGKNFHFSGQFLKFFEVALHFEMPNNFICITDFASYVFSGQNILLINYFSLLFNIHIVIYKGPEIEPNNNI